MNYIQYSFNGITAADSEMLIALLSKQGFDGFEELPKGLKAFIAEDDFNEAGMQETLDKFTGINVVRSVVENINWNAQWESNFEPVLVHDFAAIRASFHAPVDDVRHEIIITPKMSFGTGHHATTFLMIEQMEQLDLTQKSILDFGTGTGVLAILAEKCGALKIDAIDNDDWSIDNAQENILANHCTKIALLKAEAIPAGMQADIILANINLNVITANLPRIKAACNGEATILFSGLLISDRSIIKENLSGAGFSIVGFYERDNWLAIKTTYSNKPLFQS